MLAALSAVFALPPLAAAETVLGWRDAERVLGAAVTYHHQKTIERKGFEAACYLDPDVDNSMRCAWRWATGGADPFRMQQKIKKNATKWCKKAGGRKCVLFWQNGRLRFDGLSSEQSEVLDTILGKIPEYKSEGSPLPEGVGVGAEFRDRFAKGRDWLERRRKKDRRRNPHYALCADEEGPGSWFYARGGAEHSSTIRDMCVLKCTALNEFLSNEGKCYVVYENGSFVNSAAEQAVMQ